MASGDASAESFTDRIKRDASFVASNSLHVKISEDAIKAFVDNLTLDEWNSFSHGEPTAPEDVSTLRDVLLYWGFLDMMNFGSGFRSELHQLTQLGAYESMRRCVYNLWKRGALGTAVPSQAVIQECLGANIPLLIQHIHLSLTQCADTLRKLNVDTLADWILRRTNEIKSSNPSGKVSAIEFSKELFDTFETFRDVSLYQGREIVLGKKAQLLCADLHRQLGEKESLFSFDDVERLTVFSDNVLPAVLGHFGILRFSESLAAHLTSGKPLPRGDEEVELRACAIHASELIVKYANEKSKEGKLTVPLHNSCDLDFYLWMKGKDPSVRKVHRHYTQDTYFY